MALFVANSNIMIKNDSVLAKSIWRHIRGRFRKSGTLLFEYAHNNLIIYFPIFEHFWSHFQVGALQVTFCLFLMSFLWRSLRRHHQQNITKNSCLYRFIYCNTQNTGDVIENHHRSSFAGAIFDCWPTGVCWHLRLLLLWNVTLCVIYCVYIMRVYI